jgi:hypothetical protein
VQKFGVGSHVELKLYVVTLDGFFGGLYGSLLVRNYSTQGFFVGKVFLEKLPGQLFFFLLAGFSRLLCFIDFMARAGHASTQMLQVLPTHFSLSNCTVESFAKPIASTGQSAMQLPQLKHLSLSTSISLGTVTETPRWRKAFMTFSSMSSGTSARISPPFELICADKIAMGTLYSMMICEAIGSFIWSSSNLIRILPIKLPS